MPSIHTRAPPPPIKVSRMKYILQYTMGSPKAFEFRRAELAAIASPAPPPPSPAAAAATALPTDSEVLESYRIASRPGGCYYEYLHHAQLAACVGNTLFVHGAVIEEVRVYLPTYIRPVADAHGSKRNASIEWCLPALSPKQKRPGDEAPRTSLSSLGCTPLSTFHI